MKPLEFTHLTTKLRVCVTRELVYAIMPSEALGGTYILGNGGAIVPVLASPEEVEKLVYGQTNKDALIDAKKRALQQKLANREMRAKQKEAKEASSNGIQKRR